MLLRHYKAVDNKQPRATTRAHATLDATCMITLLLQGLCFRKSCGTKKLGKCSDTNTTCSSIFMVSYYWIIYLPHASGVALFETRRVCSRARRSSWCMNG